MEWIIEGIYSFAFSLFGIEISSDNLGKTVINLLNPNIIMNAQKFTLYKYVEDINLSMVAIGTSLLTLFFMIQLVKLLTQDGVERASWQKIVLRVALFFLLAAFVKGSLSFFKEISNMIYNGIYLPVEDKIGFKVDEVPFNLTEEIMAIINSQDNILKEVLYTGVFIILAIPYMASIIMILSQVFLRAVKLLLYMMFSPIPIALAAEGDTYRGKAISFFMQFAGVCFEAVIIYIGTFIYMTGMKSAVSVDGTFGIIIAILFNNGLFAALISLSSQLSDRFFGRG